MQFNATNFSSFTYWSVSMSQDVLVLICIALKMHFSAVHWTILDFFANCRSTLSTVSWSDNPCSGLQDWQPTNKGAGPNLPNGRTYFSRFIFTVFLVHLLLGSASCRKSYLQTNLLRKMSQNIYISLLYSTFHENAHTGISSGQLPPNWLSVLFCNCFASLPLREDC